MARWVRMSVARLVKWVAISKIIRGPGWPSPPSHPGQSAPDKNNLFVLHLRVTNVYLVLLGNGNCREPRKFF